MAETPYTHEDLAIAMLSGKASDAERAEFDRLMAGDSEFRHLVEDLRVFMRADAEVPATAAAPVGLLDDIMAEIDAIEPAAQPRAAPASDVVIQKEPWRSISVISALAACIAIAAHFVPMGAAPVSEPGRDMLAVLSDEEEPQLVMIIYDREAQQIVARYENVEVPDERVWQLWLIREGEDAPRSLGVFEQVGDAGKLRVPRPETPAGRNDVLAISLEPPGGAPGEAPTGPILFTGRVGTLD